MKMMFWVCYSETTPLQAGGIETRDRQHFGTECLKTAQESVATLQRDYVAQGKSILSYKGVMHDAWIEVELRGRINQ